MEASESARSEARLAFELARAVRVRRAHPKQHPVAREARERCEALWRELAGSRAELVLEPRDGALADDLRRHQLARLELRRERDGGEIGRAIERLAGMPAAEQAPVAAAPAVASPAQRAPAPSSAPTPRPVPQTAAPSELSPDMGPDLAQRIAELVRLLAELERCEELGSYNLLANRIELCVDLLVRGKNARDAYRAALVLARHATDKDARSDSLRREAGERLRRLAHVDELLTAIVEQACSASGLASVQASQVLIAIGSLAVPVLLRQHESPREAERARARQILIALGDAALAHVAQELGSAQPERMRRAARLLGEMQNPRGVPFLADALGGSDVALAREAAQAMARVGDDAACAALVAGMARAPVVAEACAAALGGIRHPAALRALGDAIQLDGPQPEAVQRAAMRSLARLGGSEALARLVRVLDHAPLFGRARVRAQRVAAAQAIAQIGGVSALRALHAHARGGDESVRQACQEALRRMERAGAKT